MAHSNKNKSNKGTEIFLALIHETNNKSLTILLNINLQSRTLPGQLLILYFFIFYCSHVMARRFSASTDIMSADYRLQPPDGNSLKDCIKVETRLRPGKREAVMLDYVMKRSALTFGLILKAHCLCTQLNIIIINRGCAYNM